MSSTPVAITTSEPAHPDRVVGSVISLNAQNLESALGAAGHARMAWSVDGAARAEALHRWSVLIEADSDELANLASREVGKPIRESAVEVARAVRILRYYAQLVFDEEGWIFPSAPGTRLEVDRRPIGTALILAPWNFPVAIPIWKMAPALAFGNVVLFRPSSLAAVTAARILELAENVFPPGVLTVIPSDVGLVASLLDDRRIDAVSFTGSTAVGQSIISRVATRGGAVQAEMGGNNASIVLADADLETAAATIAEASMAYAGQKCTATSRVVVERDVASKFRMLLVEHLGRLTVGEPDDLATAIGPLITSQARDNVANVVQQAVDRGARVLTGGSAIEREGYYFEPTLLELTDPHDEFAQAETFGPAASLIEVDSAADAVNVANASRFGLSGAVFGRDVERALKVARSLDVGLVRVNASTTGVDFHVPFGGNRESSYGPREQGRAAREFFTTTRTVLVRS